MNIDDIKKVIEKTLEGLTVSFDAVDVVEDDIHTIFMIQTNDSGVLIGNNGENLRALNHVIKKIAHSNTKNSDEIKNQFTVDVNGYNQRRIQEIKDQAAILSERVRLFKSSVEMNPMNAYERMVVHSLLSDDSEIETCSEGEGRYRRIVLKYVMREPQQAIDSELKL